MSISSQDLSPKLQMWIARCLLHIATWMSNRLYEHIDTLAPSAVLPHLFCCSLPHFSRWQIHLSSSLDQIPWGRMTPFSLVPHIRCVRKSYWLILKSFPGSDYLSPPPLPPSSLGLIWLHHSFPVQPVFNTVARVNLQKHKWERATPAQSSISLRVKACLGNFSLFSGYQSQARTKP